MIRLTDVPGRDSETTVLLSGIGSGTAAESRAVLGVSGSYELAVGFADSGLSWPDYIDRLSTGAPDQGRARGGTVPFLPGSRSMATVYSFGYTHSSVNGKKVEKGNLDFYYKGPGDLLVTDGDRLTGSSPVLAGGIEVEYCAIYCVNKDGQAVYLGFTLANDFSDAGLRTAHRNLANLSKLHPSVVSSEVVLGDLPRSSRVTASIEREGSVAWEREGVLGRDEMIYSRALMERLLLGRRDVFRPGMIVYLLLGSCISSHKDGIDLQDSDRITIRDCDSGLALRNYYFC